MANQNQGPRGPQRQGGQDAGKGAGPVLPEGEKVGEWSEDEEDEGMIADSGPAEEGGGGFNAPGGNRQSESEKPGGGDRRWGK